MPTRMNRANEWNFILSVLPLLIKKVLGEFVRTILYYDVDVLFDGQ